MILLNGLLYCFIIIVTEMFFSFFSVFFSLIVFRSLILFFYFFIFLFFYFLFFCFCLSLCLWLRLHLRTILLKRIIMIPERPLF
jgi:hypothetical protein